MKALVTGCTGYIGRHITRQLLAQGAEVFGFARRNDGKLPPERFLEGDVQQADFAAWLAQIQPEVVFHAVGTSPKSDFESQLLINAEGTRRLLQALQDTGLKPRVIVVGSAAEYGLRNEPVNEEAECLPEGEYGKAKLMQTQIAQLYARRMGLPVTVGRIFNAYGNTDRHLVVASMAAQMAQAELASPRASEIRVQNLASKRDFIHIDDAVSALLALAQLPEKDSVGGIYNIASGDSVAISTVLEHLCNLTRLDAEDVARIEITLQGAQHEDISRANISKIRAHTGWQPKITLEEGLRRELESWRARLSAPVPTP